MMQALNKDGSCQKAVNGWAARRARDCARIPFVERLIGTIRHEYFDRVFFWNDIGPIRKLVQFKDYHNAHRVHRALAGSTSAQRAGAPSELLLRLTTTLGGTIVVGCFTPRSLLENQFATHGPVTMDPIHAPDEPLYTSASNPGNGRAFN